MECKTTWWEKKNYTYSCKQGEGWEWAARIYFIILETKHGFPIQKALLFINLLITFLLAKSFQLAARMLED